MTTGWLIWARQTARGYLFRVATGPFERGGRGTGCRYMPSHLAHLHATMQGYNNDKQIEVTAVTHACCCQDLQQGFSATTALRAAVSMRPSRFCGSFPQSVQRCAGALSQRGCYERPS